MRVALVVFLSMITTAAAFGQDTTAEKMDSLEKRVRALEAVIGKQRPAAVNPGAPLAAGRATSSPETEDKGQMLLKLIKWSASIKEGQYYTNYYVISYSLLNDYDKPVKAIRGSLKFFDPDGANILELKLDRYAGIEPGKEGSFKAFQAIDQSIDSETRLKILAPENVRAELKISTIKFRDNTIIVAK
jgi:hypothetical protein